MVKEQQEEEGEVHDGSEVSIESNIKDVRKMDIRTKNGHILLLFHVDKKRDSLYSVHVPFRAKRGRRRAMMRSINCVAVFEGCPPPFQWPISEDD